MTDKPQFVGKKVRLGDIVKIEKASMPSGNNVWVLNLDAVEKGTGKVIVKNRMKADSAGTSTVAFTADAVLYSKLRPNLNKVVVADEPGLATSEMLPLIVNPEVLDRRYFAYLLRSNSFVNLAVSSTAGSKMPRMNKKTLLNAVFPIPSLELQHQRIDLLSSIEKARTKAELLIQQLDTLVKSRFVEMFGDPCDANGNRAKVKVASICELRIGPFGSALHKNDYISGGHPLINPSHIIGSSIIPDADLTVSDDKYKSLEAYHLLPGDIVLGRRGEIGRCAVVQDKGFLCGTGSMVLRPRAGVRSEYLQRVVSFPSFRQALERNAVDVTMKNLNAKIVGAADMYLPSINQQDDFISFTKQVDKSRFGGMLHLLNSLSGIMHASFFSVADTD